MHGEKLDCNKCTKETCDGLYMRWQSEEGVYTERCPNLFVKESAVPYLVWKRYKDTGYLPYDGGWADQPAPVMDVIFALDDEYAKLQAEDIENAKSKR